MMICRNKWIRCVLTCMLVIVLHIVTVIPSFAKTTQAETVLVVGQEFTVAHGMTPNVGTKIRYKLIPCKAGSPMPEGTNSEEEYYFELDNTQQIEIKMNYDRVGLYQYKVMPIIEKELEGYTYDKTEYSINVHVKNLEDGLAVTVVGTNQDNEKIPKILYKNSYEVKQIDGDIQTGDNVSTHIYGAICIFSLIIILTLVFVRKKIE